MGTDTSHISSCLLRREKKNNNKQKKKKMKNKKGWESECSFLWMGKRQGGVLTLLPTQTPVPFASFSTLLSILLPHSLSVRR